MILEQIFWEYFSEEFFTDWCEKWRQPWFSSSLKKVAFFPQRTAPPMVTEHPITHTEKCSLIPHCDPLGCCPCFKNKKIGKNRRRKKKLHQGVFLWAIPCSAIRLSYTFFHGVYMSMHRSKEEYHQSKKSWFSSYWKKIVRGRKNGASGYTKRAESHTRR